MNLRFLWSEANLIAESSLVIYVWHNVPLLQPTADYKKVYDLPTHPGSQVITWTWVFGIGALHVICKLSIVLKCQEKSVVYNGHVKGTCTCTSPKAGQWSRVLRWSPQIKYMSRIIAINNLFCHNCYTHHGKI